MSPGSVTETLFFFVATYQASDRIGVGGGQADEGEDIDMLELDIGEALAMIESGGIRDGKTIMLLQYAALHLFGPTGLTASNHSAAARSSGPGG